MAFVSDLQQQSVPITPVRVPKRTAANEASRILFSWCRRSPYSFYGRHYYSEVQRKLLDLAQSTRPDLIWLDHLDSYQYASQMRSRGHLVAVDLHNVYSLIVRRLRLETKNPLRRFVLGIETHFMRRMESQICKSQCLICAVSDEEAEHFRSLGAKHVHVVPNGTDTKRFAAIPTGRRGGVPSILFLGTLSWGPNVDAARILVERIFPEVQKTIPAAKLALVGKDPCPEVLAFAQQPGVTVHSNVPDTIPYLEQATVMAVPLISGGGTRLKILEAMASGLPVVSTAVGAEGLAVKNSENILLADVQTMGQEIVELLVNRELNLTIATEARRLVCEVYDWEKIGDRCIHAITQYVHALKKR